MLARNLAGNDGKLQSEGGLCPLRMESAGGAAAQADDSGKGADRVQKAAGTSKKGGEIVDNRDMYSYKGKRPIKDKLLELAAGLLAMAGGMAVLYAMAFGVYLLIGPWR